MLKIYNLAICVGLLSLTTASAAVESCSPKIKEYSLLIRTRNGETLQERQKRALDTIYNLCIDLKRKPKNIELKTASVPVDQWKGIGIYRHATRRPGLPDSSGPKAHLRWNDTLDEAWAPIISRLEETKPSEDISAEEIQRIIAEIKGEIRNSWSVEQLRNWADQQIVNFILEHKRLPRNFKRADIMEFNDIQVNYEQWTGTGSYRERPGNSLRGRALHPNSTVAWWSIKLLLLEKIAELDNKLEYESLLNEIDSKIERNAVGIERSEIFLRIIHSTLDSGYFQKRADMAAENPDIQKQIKDALRTEATQIYLGISGEFELNETSEFSPSLVALVTEAVIHELRQQTLLPAEVQRIEDFYPKLVGIIAAQNRHLIRSANYRSLFSGYQEGAETDVAMEILNEYLVVTFLKAPFDRNRNNVNSSDSKLFFLVDIFTRKLIDKIRRHTARTRSGSRQHFEYDPAFGIGAVNPESLNSDELAQLRQAIDQLPEEQAEVINLAYGTDLTIEEMSEYTETPTGTIKSRLHRARAKLFEILSSSSVAPL